MYLYNIQTSFKSLVTFHDNLKGVDNYILGLALAHKMVLLTAESLLSSRITLQCLEYLSSI